MSCSFKIVHGKFYFIFEQILDDIWPMIQQQTVCGVCCQSHGVEQYRLNLEAFKFWLMMITDKVVGATKIQADVVLDAIVCVCVCGGGVYL